MKKHPDEQWKSPPERWTKLKKLARDKRHEPTEAEAVLWQHLRNRQLCGIKFRRQHAIGQFIVDFYAPALNLIIEVDGSHHSQMQEEDSIRQAYLESLGLHILRFTNEDVSHNLSHVLNQIGDAISGRLA